MSKCKWAATMAIFVATVAFAAGIVTSHLSSDAEMLAALTAIAFVAEGRIGDRGGAATFELDLGEDTGAPAQTAQFDWQSGVTQPFTLSYNQGTNTVSFSLGGETLNFQPGLSFKEMFIRVRAVNDQTSIAIDNLVLNAMNVGDLSSTVGPDGLDILAISGVDLGAGFTLTGDATLSWSGSPPTQSRLAFQIKVGNAPTVPVEETTWGGLKSVFR